MHERSRSVGYVALVALLAAGLGACGSDYKGLTKAQFLQKANANCEHTSKAAEALRREVAAAPTPEAKAKVYQEKVLPRFDQELDQLAKLKPPKADRDRVNGIIEQARRDKSDFAALLERDPLLALAPSTHKFEKSGAAATAYGLKICVD
jgi:hypothetical protein